MGRYTGVGRLTVIGWGIDNWREVIFEAFKILIYE